MAVTFTHSFTRCCYYYCSTYFPAIACHTTLQHIRSNICFWHGLNVVAMQRIFYFCLLLYLLFPEKVLLACFLPPLFVYFVLTFLLLLPRYCCIILSWLFAHLFMALYASVPPAIIRRCWVAGEREQWEVVTLQQWAKRWGKKTLPNAKYRATK